MKRNYLRKGQRRPGQSRGTVYFDCVQMEKSASAGRFNLVENGDFFYRGGTASDAMGWTREEAASASSDKRVTTAGTGAAELDAHAFTIVGAAAQMKHVNQVWFDGIHLYKDEFGNSYAYDDNGNVISVSDLQRKSTTYEYSSNNLTKAVLPNQARLKYTYDSYHNVKTAVSGEDVKDAFTYDTYGNNTSVKVVDPANSSAPAIEANAEYTGNGNYLSSVTDGNRGTVSYGYDVQTGLLGWVKGLGDNSFNKVIYSYNNLQQLTGVSKYLEENEGVANGSTSTVSYAYSEDNLSTSTHGGTAGTPTTYAFTYAAFNALSKVKAGSHTLIENTYDVNNRTFNLMSEKYGNNQRVNYTYDSTGRMLSKAWEGNSNDRVEYVYDNEEGLAAVRDVRNNITTKYIYDLSDRLVQTRQTGSVNR